MTSKLMAAETDFVHPLAFELNGKFEHTLNDEAMAALERRSLANDESFCRAMKTSVTSMIHASQVAEMDHLYGYSLTKSVSPAFMQSEHVPTDEAYDNYIAKVTNEATVGEGVLWLSEKALTTYQQASKGKRYIFGRKNPFEAGGILNNGRLESTERLDRVIGRLPELLEAAGAKIADVQTFARDGADTHIRHRLWPVELSSDETYRFYAGHGSTRHYTLRRRRPIYDILFKMTDADDKEQLLLGEAYKESFALVTPSLFSTAYGNRFEQAFAAHSISDILGKGSAVAEICGEAFRTVIDTRNETTPAVVPTYTCLMFRFSNPYAANPASSPLSPSA